MLLRNGSAAVPIDDMHVLYRFLREASWADAFMAGSVHLSTLQACRGYEQPDRGDPDEGHREYRSGLATGNADDKVVRHVAETVGIRLGSEDRVKNITINNCTAIEHVDDAWVICCSVADKPSLRGRYGQHGIRIDRPRSFFEAVAKALANKLNVGIHGGAATVVYRQRVHSQLETPQVHPTFLKDPKFADDEEARFAFQPKRSDVLVAPIAVHIPGVIRHLTRL